MRRNRGFSLIELMITVGIIGILTLIAMPVYGDYVKRVIVAEGLELGNSHKAALAAFYAENGRCPAQDVILPGQNVDIKSSEFPISGSGMYVESVTFGGGGYAIQNAGQEAVELCVITITYKLGHGLESKWNSTGWGGKTLNASLNLAFFTGDARKKGNSVGHPSKWFCYSGAFQRGYLKTRYLPRGCFLSQLSIFSEIFGTPEPIWPPNLFD